MQQGAFSLEVSVAMRYTLILRTGIRAVVAAREILHTSLGLPLDTSRLDTPVAYALAVNETLSSVGRHTK